MEAGMQDAMDLLEEIAAFHRLIDSGTAVSRILRESPHRGSAMRASVRWPSCGERCMFPREAPVVNDC
jgi:hypothetical protein